MDEFFGAASAAGFPDIAALTLDTPPEAPGSSTPNRSDSQKVASRQTPTPARTGQQCRRRRRMNGGTPPRDTSGAGDQLARSLLRLALSPVSKKDNAKKDIAASGKPPRPELPLPNNGLAALTAAPGLTPVKAELTCNICLEMFIKPITLPCGHSFCCACIKATMVRCSTDCPQCRKAIGVKTQAEMAVNVALWSTIQLLFPGEADRQNESPHVSANRAPTASLKDKHSGFTNASELMQLSPWSRHAAVNFEPSDSSW